MSETRDLTPQDPRSPEELADPRVPPSTHGAGESGHIEAPGGPYEFPEPPPQLDEADVRRWLERVGKLVAWVLPTPEVLELEEPPLWRFTEEELGELTPPLTRVLNRRLLWLAGVIRNADELEVGFLLFEYVSGNLDRVREARAAEEAAVQETEEERRADLPEGHPERGPASFGLEGD